MEIWFNFCIVCLCGIYILGIRLFVCYIVGWNVMLNLVVEGLWCLIKGVVFFKYWYEVVLFFLKLG